MSDPENTVDLGDEEMAEVEVVDPEEGAADPSGLEDIEPTIPKRTTFLECVPSMYNILSWH